MRVSRKLRHTHRHSTVNLNMPVYPPLYGILCPLTKTAHCSFALEKHNDI